MIKRLKAFSYGIMDIHQWIYDEVCYRFGDVSRMAIWLAATVLGMTIKSAVIWSTGKPFEPIVFVITVLAMIFAVSILSRALRPFTKESLLQTERDRAVLWVVVLLFLALWSVDDVLEAARLGAFYGAMWLASQWLSGFGAICFFLVYEDVDGDKRRARDEKRLMREALSAA